MPPTMIWPSAPMFQNFILNAGAMARAAPKSGMATRTVTLAVDGPPREPVMMS